MARLQTGRLQTDDSPAAIAAPGLGIHSFGQLILGVSEVMGGAEQIWYAVWKSSSVAIFLGRCFVDITAKLIVQLLLLKRKLRKSTLNTVPVGTCANLFYHKQQPRLMPHRNQQQPTTPSRSLRSPDIKSLPPSASFWRRFRLGKAMAMGNLVGACLLPESSFPWKSKYVQIIRLEHHRSSLAAIVIIYIRYERKLYLS